jgi:hypothetical protein
MTSISSLFFVGYLPIPGVFPCIVTDLDYSRLPSSYWAPFSKCCNLLCRNLSPRTLMQLILTSQDMVTPSLRWFAVPMLTFIIYLCILPAEWFRHEKLDLAWLGLGQLFRAWLPIPLVANYRQMLWKGSCCVISCIDGCHELFVCAKVGSWELILNFANIVFWDVGCGDRWCSQGAQINQVPQNLMRVPDNHIQCWIVRQRERAFCPMCCSCRRLYGVVLSWSKPLKMSCAGSCSPWSVSTLQRFQMAIHRPCYWESALLWLC